MTDLPRVPYVLCQERRHSGRWFSSSALKPSTPVSAHLKLLPAPQLIGTAETIEAIDRGELRSAMAFASLSVYGKLTGRGSVSLSQNEPGLDDIPTFRVPRSVSTGESRWDKSGATVSAGVPLAKRLATILQLPLALCMSPTGPLAWPGELMDFQRQGVHVLVASVGVLLADDMGLGKTIQAAAAMRLLARSREIETMLIVTPAALLRNWRNEMSKWAPELRTIEVSGPRDQRLWKWNARVHVKIVSYETLLSDSQFLEHQGVCFDLMCLDEAQRIKNRETAISGLVRKIPCARRWALTGTPLENSLDDVRSILSFIEPDAFIGLLGDDEIPSVLKRLQLRRKKSEVLPQLPPKTITELFVRLSKEQRDEYDILHTGGVSELRHKGAFCTVTDILALIIRLKQVCNFSAGSGRSSKLEDVAARLSTLRAEGHKALIFSQFTSEDYGVRRLASALHQFRPVCYTGDMGANQRQQAIDTFEQEPDAGVLILSLKAGGVGLNLQRASYVFHFDRWWNPASEVQAEDRSHRIGQTRGVSVYKYICENTIEERIHEILVAKKALFDEYVDDICLDFGDKFTEEELFGLFGLTPGRKGS